MPVTELQKRAAQAIVNVFETGHAAGDYGAVTVIPGDPGHLTYGRAQTTLTSGGLHSLIKAYCDAPGASEADGLRPYLPRLAAKDTSLDHDYALHAHLETAGDDPVMRQVQDAFFDSEYWEPAVESAAYVGIVTALGHAAVFDSRIHGSWHMIRDRVMDEEGTVAQLGEAEWVKAYVRTRRHWLASHPNPALHPTVYRMDELKKLIDAGNWSLALPFTVRGQRIDEAVLMPEPAPEPRRTLRLTQPPMTGEDVRELQQELANRGWAINITGIFNEGTERCVRQFQEEEGMGVDGVVGPNTWKALGF